MAAGRDNTPADRHDGDRFDFGDGGVSAARHRNPDGTTGGWVAFTAHVDAVATVGPAAQVFGNARVFGRAQVLDDAVVCDTARVYAGATVAGRAVVRGDATVEDAQITDDAVVRGRARVARGARVAGRARVGGDAKIMGPVAIHDDARVEGHAWLTTGEIGGTTCVRPGAKAPQPPLIRASPIAPGGTPLAGDEFIGLDELLDP